MKGGILGSRSFLENPVVGVTSVCLWCCVLHLSGCVVLHVCVLYFIICIVLHVCMCMCVTRVISYVFCMFLCIMLRTGIFLHVLHLCMYGNMFVIPYFRQRTACMAMCNLPCTGYSGMSTICAAC